MNPFNKLSGGKRKTLVAIEQHLDAGGENTYPLGKIIKSELGNCSLFGLFRKTMSISANMKNEEGHSGLLILGWGGAGKTVLANNIAHNAHLAGHQIIRYYQHEEGIEVSGEGTSKFRDKTEFFAALTELGESDSIHPTVVIIDSLEAYLSGSYLEQGQDEGSPSSLEQLNALVAVKVKLENRFANKILFVFVLKDNYDSEIFPIARAHTALTITGQIPAHYAIEPLWDKTSSSGFFWQISELKTGEFIVLDKKPQTFVVSISNR